MCLAVPGRVVSLDEPGEGLVMGKVSFGGVERDICFGYAPDAKVGSYVLVHVGFAIAVLDEEEAQRILDDFEIIARLAADEDAQNAGQSEGKPS